MAARSDVVPDLVDRLESSEAFLDRLQRDQDKRIVEIKYARKEKKSGLDKWSWILDWIGLGFFKETAHRMVAMGCAERGTIRPVVHL